MFEGISDPRRVSSQQHSLHDILVMVLCTLLSGGETCTDMALLRKLVLNPARLEPCKGSRRSKLKRARWDNNFLTTMLTHFANLPMR